MLFYLVISFLAVITFLYCIRFYRYGAAIPIGKGVKTEYSARVDEMKVTLLIPVRNEEKNLPFIQHDILEQDYPQELLEVMYINDHSTDGSPELMNQYAAEHNHIHVFSLPDDQVGKKNAIRKGIHKATSDYVIQTDADCRMGSSFVSTHAATAAKSPGLVAGPVKYTLQPGLFNKLEALEFYSLAGITAGSFLTNKPAMCNAANLSYPTSLFRNAYPHLKDKSHPSGDDVFLLEYVVKNHLSGAFLSSPSAVVETRGNSSLKAFVNQRIRWGSKAKYYSNRHLVYLGVLVYAMNFLIVAGLVCSAVNVAYLPWTALAFIMKSLADAFYMFRYITFIRQPVLMYYFPALVLVYPFYLIIMSSITLFSRFSWKNRRYH